MIVNLISVCLVVLPWFIMGQLQFQHPGQYGPSVSGDMFQQQQHQMQQQQQLPMHQQQQQQIPMHQQQQQQQMQQQQQPQVQMNPQQQPQVQMNPQQQPQVPMNPQQQPQVQMIPQQQPYYQGNMAGPSIQSIQPPPLANQFQQPTHDHQAPSVSSGPNERYLVGNLSETFSFQVAPPSIKVSYLGLNGYSLYIVGVGFSNKSKFSYDEQNNRLTILSLDSTTVGYYAAVDANWQTFANILSAIDVSSLQIHNSHASEDNNGSSLVSCSVSIIRSTFRLTEPPSSSNNLAILPPSRSSPLVGTENLPRLDLFLSTRTQLTTLPNNKIYNDTLNEQIFTRTITIQRPLSRADHNGTIQCQVESNNNIDIFLIKKVPIDVEYGPNLETGALPIVNLESEVLKVISLECQIEANPNPSYVWYEMSGNASFGGMMPYYGHQNPYGQQYPLHPQSNIPTAGLSVFGTTRQIQRIYQNSGQQAMQCQAQARGKTLKQEFIITVNPSSNGLKTGLGADGNREKSNKVPIIIGVIIGGIFLLLVVAIVIAALIFLKRRKANPNEKHTKSIEKLPNDKPGKTRWGHGSNLPADYSKYKHEVLKGDSSSTSHLVESAESSTSQPPPIANRSSPIPSTHSSYRQAPVSVSYRQASSLPGFRPPAPPIRSYSPDQDDVDEVDSHINTVPLTTNRSRTTTPFGSHKSLSESIQSLRSNQQPALSLPVKKRSHEPPPLPPPLPAPMVPKRDQRTPSPKSFDAKKDYQHHHYHNPAQLRAQQQKAKNNDVSSEDEELEQQQQQQQLNNVTEDSAGTGPVAPSKTSLGYNQVDYHHQQQQQHGRRVITPPPPQKMVVHQPTGIHHDEAPPSYHQVANPATSSTSYVYQEPTEV